LKPLDQLRLEKRLKKAGPTDKFLLTANLELPVPIEIKKQNPFI
jgi:hypothetical protein